MEEKKTNRNQQETTLSFLDQCIKKCLRIRRAWDIFFRIVPPSTPDAPYSVILEKGASSEKFFLTQRDVARSVAAATDVYLTTDLRLAIQRLEKRANRKSKS